MRVRSFSLFTFRCFNISNFFAPGSHPVCSVRRALPLRVHGLRAPCASLLTFCYKINTSLLRFANAGRRKIVFLPLTWNLKLENLNTMRGHLVIWSFVKIENGCCQNRHYNINILFIYSEQITAFPKSKMTK